MPAARTVRAAQTLRWPGRARAGVLDGARSLPLNRLLRQIVTQADFRTAFVQDRDAAIAASGLDADEREALAADGFDHLVELGAHPLLALSAWQVVKNQLAAAH
jgi:2,3-dihydroxyphenylpropionate 1,2-dioxygenase